MRLIKNKNYKIMPWKNGLGTTAEIAAHPDLHWRLSAATVTAANAFSDFSGYRRFLAIWKGEGLKLNEFILRRNQVYEFGGEEEIFCENLSPEVIDVGFIFRPDKVKATMKIVEGFPTISEGLNFFFCAEGSLQIANLTVNEGDTLEINSPLISLPKSRLKLIHIEILPL